jgi:cytochrome c5
VALRPAHVGIALVALALAACSGGDSAPEAASAPADPAIPVWDVPLDDPELEAGRLVWRGTCVRCHGTGLAGAPRITDREAWAPRIAKGMDVLVEHALNGFQGPAGTEMPARGGNPDLTDDQVTLAVAFVTSRSR